MCLLCKHPPPHLPEAQLCCLACVAFSTLYWSVACAPLSCSGQFLNCLSYVFLQVNVRVTTMDAELEFAVQPSTTGKQLFDQVCMHSYG